MIVFLYSSLTIERIVNMYSANMSFCLLLKFFDGLKAKYQVHFGTNDKVEFQLVEGSIVGNISCFEDGFPMKKRIYESLSMTPYQIKIAESIIYNGMASALPRILLEHGHDTIWFTHKLPQCVSPISMALVSKSVRLHNISPGPLQIID